MMTITTLDDVREYFRWLTTQPLPTGPHECEANLIPLMEAFRDWDVVDLAGLFIQVGLTLATHRGEDGKAVLADATLQISRTIYVRQEAMRRVN